MRNAMSTTVYVETSAALAWLLREDQASRARQALESAGQVVTSQLTLIECRRAIHRYQQGGRLSEADALAARHLLEEAAEQWVVMDLVGEVIRRAGEPFPQEPLRTLDALHLASVLVFHQSLGDVLLLTLDARLSRNAEILGLKLAA